ncbi:MAG: DUF3570 domain-containing protein [Polyangiales bacterium]
MQLTTRATRIACATALTLFGFLGAARGGPSAAGAGVPSSGLDGWSPIDAPSTLTSTSASLSAPSPAPSASEVPEDPSPASTAPARPARTIETHLSSEIAFYGDDDHVFVLSPTIGATLTDPIAGWSATGRYLVDLVSAASADIVSAASPNYREMRQVGSGEVSYKPHTFGVSANANVSIEPDYHSYTGGGSLTQDFYDKNLTALLAYSHGHDIAGRTGTSFDVFSRVLDVESFKGGATMLLNRSSLLSLVGDYVYEHGDPSKPYRYVPLFAPGVDVPLGASAAQVAELRTPVRVLEQLPLSRLRYAVTAHYARRYDASTFRADERIYTDSWGLHASTTDARWLFDVSRRMEVGPHFRFHAQTAVDFWQRAFTLDAPNDYPALRTGDRELGPLLSGTAGGTLRLAIGSDATPRSWIFGVDVNLNETRYLDDLYLTNRIAFFGAFTLETEQ